MKILKKLRRRGLPLFLALVMCSGALQVTAFASTADEEAAGTKDPVTVSFTLENGEATVTVDGEPVVENLPLDNGTEEDAGESQALDGLEGDEDLLESGEPADSNEPGDEGESAEEAAAQESSGTEEAALPLPEDGVQVEVDPGETKTQDIPSTVTPPADAAINPDGSWTVVVEEGHGPQEQPCENPPTAEELAGLTPKSLSRKISKTRTGTPASGSPRSIRWRTAGSTRKS